MTNYVGAVKKRTVSVHKYFDEEGRLTSEDTVEEIEYLDSSQFWYQNPQWWQNPVISNGSNRAVNTGAWEPPTL